MELQHGYNPKGVTNYVYQIKKEIRIRITNYPSIEWITKVNKHTE